MDINATEIQIRVKRADGSYESRWLPLSELVKLMEQTAGGFFDAVIARRLAELRPSPSGASQTPPE